MHIPRPKRTISTINIHYRYTKVKHFENQCHIIEIRIGDIYHLA